MATFLLAGLLCVGAVLFVAVCRRRTRKPGEPPLLKGWIPLIGLALEYVRNPLGFLQTAQQKYGDIFTCLLAGKYITFFADPFSISVVMRQGKNLDFQKFAKGFSQRVFGHADFTSPKFSESYQEVQSLYRQTLQGPALEHLTQNMLGNLETVFQRSLASETCWKEEGLQSFTNRIMFEVGFLTLFGKKAGLLQPEEFNTAETWMQKAKQDFFVLDGVMPVLAAGVPIALCGRAWRAREALAKEFMHDELHHRTCISDLIQRRMNAFDRMPLDEQGKAHTHISMLWASQANTLPAAFWSLYYTLLSPDALDAALLEIEGIFQECGDPSNLSKQQLESMTVLDSIIKEALRLSSASMMIRVANDNFTLTLDSGQKADIRKGDYIAFYPRLVHLDPEIYSDPMEFKYDRFLDETGQGRNQFMKNGRVLKNFLMPFGSGVSECPGRFFAINEIKQFLSLVLWHYDLHLSEPHSELSLDRTRAGLGILTPSKDVLLKYRARADRANKRHKEKLCNEI